MVAPLTGTQNSGIGQIAQYSSAATPFIQAASTYANKSATPISLQDFNSANIGKYMSPYTQNVVDATRALLNQQNAEQQINLQGNITAAGAWNGDRAPIVQSILARNQKLADDATLSNIINQGYQGAVNQFNTGNQTALQAQQLNDQNAAGAAYSLGSLGTALQSAGLSGGAALLNAGTLEQQNLQQQLNVPYQQYVQQQAYPYQSLSFLASLLPTIAQGTGVGTTSSNTFDSNNYSYGTGTGRQTQPFSILRRGGRARLSDGGANGTDSDGALETASGGIPASAISLLEAQNLARAGENPVPYFGAAQAPDITSFIPTSASTGAGFSFPGTPAPADYGAPAQPMSLSMQPPALSAPTGTGLAKGLFDDTAGGFMKGLTSGQQSGPGIGGWASGLGAGLGDWAGSLFGPSAASVVAPDIAGAVAGSLGDLGSLASTPSILGLIGLKKGGRAHLADGGNDDEAAFEDILDRTYPGDGAASLSTASVPKTDRVMSLHEVPANWPKGPNFIAPSPLPSDHPPRPIIDSWGYDSDGRLERQDPSWDDGTPVSPDYEGYGLSRVPAANDGPDPIWTRMTGGQPQVIQPAYRPSPWHAIAKGFFSALGNHSIGRGVVAGLDEWEKDNHPEVDHSGQTQMLRYADGTAIDTGIPTEAALNARATRDYRNTYLDVTRQTREDAVQQRRDAAAQASRDRADALAQRAQEAKDRAAERAVQLQIARMNAAQGRYTYQPATQPDPNDPTKTISGYLRLSTRGDEPPQFISGYTPLKGSGADMSGRESVFANRVIGAARLATEAAKNVMELPISVDRGVFGGRQQGPGMFDALKEDMANTVTDSEAKRYNVILSGLTRNLGAIETAGLAVPGSLTHNLGSVVIQAGDDNYTKLSKMAEIRQIVDMGMEPMLHNPRVPAETKTYVKDIMGQIKTAIPFTQHDVTTFAKRGKPSQSFSEFVGANKVGDDGRESVATPTSKAEYDALPHGAHYRKADDPQGSYRVKP